MRLITALKEKIKKFIDIIDFRLWLESKGNPKRLEEYELFIEPYYKWLESEDRFKSKQWFKSKPLAPMTIETRLRAITSFFRYNDIIYQPLERSSDKPTILTVNRGIPTKENVRAIL